MNTLTCSFSSQTVSSSFTQDVVVLSGNSNVILADRIAQHLNLSFNYDNLPSQFSNGEVRCQIKDDLRGKHIFIVQSGCGNPKLGLSINDTLMEAFLLIDACRRSMAATVNIIMPCYPYARGDKKDEPRAPIPAKLVSYLLDATKVDRIIAMDLHAGQIQGFTDKPFDNLYSIGLVLQSLDQQLFREVSQEQRQDRYIVVAPDAGATKRTVKFAKAMMLDTIIMHKQRNYSQISTVEKTVLVHESNSQNFSGKTAIICDDMADTCGTLIKSVEELVKNGIEDVICVITHGVFSGNALDKINGCSYIKQVFVSDSIPQQDNVEKCSKIQVFSISE